MPSQYSDFFNKIGPKRRLLQRSDTSGVGRKLLQKDFCNSIAQRADLAEWGWPGLLMAIAATQGFAWETIPLERSVSGYLPMYASITRGLESTSSGDPVANSLP